MKKILFLALLFLAISPLNAQVFEGAIITSANNTTIVGPGPNAGEFSWSLGFLAGGSGGFDPYLTQGPYVKVKPIVALASVSVYPNPGNNMVNIETGSSIAQIEISNAMGQAVYSAISTTITHTVNLAHLPRAIYSIAVKTEAGVSKGRLVLE